MTDSMALHSYSEMRGYKCNTVQKVNIITTSEAKSLDEKKLGCNLLGIAHFSQGNMKHPMKTVKWYWYNKKTTFIELSHVWKTSHENSRSCFEHAKTNQKIFFNTIIQKSHKIRNLAIKG